MRELASREPLRPCSGQTSGLWGAKGYKVVHRGEVASSSQRVCPPTFEATLGLRGTGAPYCSQTIINERYTLEEPIGHGGMAEVWRATIRSWNEP